MEYTNNLLDYTITVASDMVYELLHGMLGDGLALQQRTRFEMVLRDTVKTAISQSVPTDVASTGCVEIDTMVHAVQVSKNEQAQRVMDYVRERCMLQEGCALYNSSCSGCGFLEGLERVLYGLL